MTMSLVRGMTSLNTKKRKANKMTAGRLEKLQKDHREHNKYMKRIHAHSNVMTFDEYVEYVSGNFKPKAKTSNKAWTYEGPKVKKNMYLVVLPKIVLLQHFNGNHYSTQASVDL